ncbi:respiratory nitrate reductase subunit gamma [Ramlibacter tataouinensis]|uniref:respiratory nitrate reductase subunit gamma n=1 Tax=Ramlibacter tataouinensis TaxID=94132 RepID=UPI0022F3A543|nr:respiratory nitrate reductase subunit gamma [Ramlibacter tataouinensis]WBY03931.1 respiratory nitrate reductase subunit gamma [Ramlibacter tataouinensis]
MLLHRRLGDPRIRATSRTGDIVLLGLRWLQFALGLATIPLSTQHLDGGMMMVRQGLLPGTVVLQSPALTDAEQSVIEAMVEAEVPTRQPTEEEACRYYEGHGERFVGDAQACCATSCSP